MACAFGGPLGPGSLRSQQDFSAAGPRRLATPSLATTQFGGHQYLCFRRSAQLRIDNPSSDERY
jgi:hypothetical protein